MFGAVVRATLVLVAGSLLAYTLTMAAGPVLDTQEDAQRITEGENDPEVDTPTSEWGRIIVDWWPAIVVATTVALLIGAAVTRRRRVRV